MKKNFVAAVSVLVGTCIGAGILGIPYVASKTGFIPVLFYILLLGGIILLLNLYLGEITLRTKEVHQLPGYAEKYLGKKARKIMELATIFGIYAAIIAYIFGVGESLSALFFGSLKYSVYLGVAFGLFMSIMIWKGVKSLKKYEKFGVAIVLILVSLIFLFFVGKINLSNLNYFNSANLFLPFGVVLFALISFFAVPEVVLILRNEKKKMKPAIFTGVAISVFVYILFVLVVVGFKGSETPEVATLALGGVFILLGIFTMSTAYLSLGNALEEVFQFDDRYKRFRSWFLSSIIPVFIYFLISFSSFFSFTKILSIGGVISGGTIAILILFMVRKSKKVGERKPEYKIPVNWFLIITLSAIFVLGVLREVFVAIKNFGL